MTSQHDQPGRIEASGIPPPLGGNEQDQLAAIAQSEFHNRRRRDSLIRYDLFAEPAWDMLLDLYIEQHSGQPVAVDRLCAPAGAARTTALSWLALLIEQALVILSLSVEEDAIVRVTPSQRRQGETELYLAPFLPRA